VNQLEIRSYFHCPVWFADASYARPTLAWLQGAFWNEFQRDRWAKGLKTWTRKNDCDGFARAYAQLAQDCHAASQETGDGRQVTDEALAVGEIFYTQRTGGRHAIVCAFTDKGRTFIEPQNGQVIELTEGEVMSCTFARF